MTTNAINNFSGTLAVAGNADIGQQAGSIITIGNNGAATSTSVAFGSAGGDFNGDGTGNLILYTSQTTGTIEIGGNGAATGGITIDPGSSAQTVSIATGIGGKSVQIATGADANSVALGTASSTSSLELSFGLNGGSLSGAGAGNLDLHTTQTTGSITIGGTGAATGFFNICGGSGAQTMNIANNAAGNKTIYVAPLGPNNSVQIGGTGSGSNAKLYFGTGGGYVDGDGTGTLNLYPSQTSGNLVLSNASATGGITLSTSTFVSGNLTFNNAGDKFFIPTGANASVGQATLASGTVTVSTTAVLGSSLIFLTNAGPSGTAGVLSVGTIVSGASFVINSSTGAADNSLVNFWIIN